MPDDTDELSSGDETILRDAQAEHVDPSDLIWMREVTDAPRGSDLHVERGELYRLMHEHPALGPYRLVGSGKRSFVRKSLLLELKHRPQHKPLGGARPSVNP